MGQYREKVCPTCSAAHRKKGPFCSKTCSNMGRDDEYKQKMRDKMLYTDEGQQRSWSLNWDEDRDAPVSPPDTNAPYLGNNQFVDDGVVWTKE